MSRRYRVQILLVLAGLLTTLSGALGSVMVNFYWKGDDLHLRFSDSVLWKVDLAESDTSQVVIKITGATAVQPATIEGPQGSQAILTESAPGEIRLTVRRSGKLGYASVWRPYSSTLVVHTFNWDKIDYPQQQYYKGLLAIEQGLDVQATELLEVAGSTGERRANSILGAYYARKGDFTKAISHLKNPVEADDYAALAAAQANNGDSAAAGKSMAIFGKMLEDEGKGQQPPRRAERAPQGARRDDAATGADAELEEDESADHGFETNEDIRASRKGLYLGGGVVALLLLIGLVVWLTRRRSGPPSAGPYSNTRPGAPRPTPTPDFDDRPRAAQERTTPRDTYAHPADMVTTEPVEATVVESRPHVIVAEDASPEPVVVEKVSDEKPVAETKTVETPTVERAAHEAPIEEKRESSFEAPAATTGVPVNNVASAHEEQSSESTATEERTTRSTPRQAADLRRRIEMMRTSASDTPAPRAATLNASESTVNEARRLQISRDSVELRRRMEQHRR